MRVGIYPGAFDPIHEGHIAFACAVGKRFKLDKIFFLVEPRPRRKQGVRAVEHRIAMTQLAVANDKHLGVIRLEESRFAIDSTWPKISAMFGDAELYMIMGESNLGHIIQWPQIAELIEQAPAFIIGTRHDETKVDLQDKLHALQRTKAFPFVYHLVDQPLPTLSSRKLRIKLKKHEIPEAIPTATADYITANKLYISGAT
jgi:nicotinate-nucleotide adenylyltransferase